MDGLLGIFVAFYILKAIFWDWFSSIGTIIRADGVPVVAFAKYEIAAGAAGIPEFPITVE